MYESNYSRPLRERARATNNAAEAIITHACRNFKITREQLKGPRRTMHLDFVRKVVIDWLKYINCTQAQIAFLLDYPDHSTIAHQFKVTQRLLEAGDTLLLSYFDEFAKLQ